MEKNEIKGDYRKENKERKKEANNRKWEKIIENNRKWEKMR